MRTAPPPNWNASNSPGHASKIREHPRFCRKRSTPCLVDDTFRCFLEPERHIRARALKPPTILHNATTTSRFGNSVMHHIKMKKLRWSVSLILRDGSMTMTTTMTSTKTTIRPFSWGLKSGEVLQKNSVSKSKVVSRKLRPLRTTWWEQITLWFLLRWKIR